MDDRETPCRTVLIRVGAWRRWLRAKRRQRQRLIVENQRRAAEPATVRKTLPILFDRGAPRVRTLGQSLDSSERLDGIPLPNANAAIRRRRAERRRRPPEDAPTLTPRPRSGRHSVRGSVTRGGGADLKIGHGAGDLAIQRLMKLERGIAQMRLHPLALRVADLSDPSVLEQGKCRQEDDQCAGEDGQWRWASSFTRRSVTRQNTRKILELKLLHS